MVYINRLKYIFTFIFIISCTACIQANASNEKVEFSIFFKNLVNSSLGLRRIANKIRQRDLIDEASLSNIAINYLITKEDLKRYSPIALKTKADVFANYLSLEGKNGFYKVNNRNIGWLSQSGLFIGALARKNSISTNEMYTTKVHIGIPLDNYKHEINFILSQAEINNAFRFELCGVKDNCLDKTKRFSIYFRDSVGARKFARKVNLHLTKKNYFSLIPDSGVRVGHNVSVSKIYKQTNGYEVPQRNILALAVMEVRKLLSHSFSYNTALNRAFKKYGVDSTILLSKEEVNLVDFLNTKIIKSNINLKGNKDMQIKNRLDKKIINKNNF